MSPPKQPPKSDPRSSRQSSRQSSRRAFLKLAGAGAPMAIAAAAVSGGAAAETPPVVPRSDRGDVCMQDTAHIRRYYDLAR